jgi:hypothetical protein
MQTYNTGDKVEQKSTKRRGSLALGKIGNQERGIVLFNDNKRPLVETFIPQEFELVRRAVIELR